MSELVSLALVAVAAIIFAYAARTSGRLPVPLWVRMWQVRNRPAREDGERLSDTEMQAWIGAMGSFATVTDPYLAATERDIEDDLREERKR